MNKVENFELGAILTIITGFNCTDDFDKVWRLVWFVCNDNMIGPMGLGVVKDKAKRHLLKIHPELESVKYQSGINIDEFVSKQEEKFGNVLPVTKVGVKLPKEYSTKPLSSTTSDEILLSREKLDEIKSSKVFNQWLNGLVNENDLTEEEKKIIYAYQLYYDLTLSDNFIYNVLDHLRCYGIDDLLNDENKIKTASIMFNVSKDDIKIQALLTKKRMEKEKALEQPKVKKLTRNDN